MASLIILLKMSNIHTIIHNFILTTLNCYGSCLPLDDHNETDHHNQVLVCMYHLYDITHCFKKWKCGPYSSLKKKMFHFPVLFAAEIFLFSPVTPQSELVQNPANISILSQAIFSLPQKFQNIGDKIENALVDLELVCGKSFSFWIFTL